MEDGTNGAVPITSISGRAGRNCSREGGEGPGNQAALPPPPLQPELEEGEARKKMAAVAAEAAATAASPGEGGAGEAEPEMEPIPGSEAGTDTLPVTATEASVPDGEADGQPSAPQADEPPLSPPRELARSPEAAGPKLEAEEKLPAQVVEAAAAAPQEGLDLPPSPAPPPEQPPAPEERQEPPLPQPAAPALVPPAGGDSAVSQLIPGSEVRVTLDHIIEDALVVSFRLGEKLFSGVLMDLSKRYRAHPQHAPGGPRSARSPGREGARAAPSPLPAGAPPPAPPSVPAWRALRVGQAREARRGRSLPQVSACEGRCATRWGARVPDGSADLTTTPSLRSRGSATLGRGAAFMQNAKDFCREPGAWPRRLLVRHFCSQINL